MCSASLALQLSLANQIIAEERGCVQVHHNGCRIFGRRLPATGSPASSFLEQSGERRMQGLRNAGLEESTRVSCGFALTWSVVLTLVTIRIVRVLSELLVLGHTPDQCVAALGTVPGSWGFSWLPGHSNMQSG